MITKDVKPYGAGEMCYVDIKSPYGKPGDLRVTRPEPFILPTDKPVAIQLSGGRTSGMLLKHLLDANPDWREDWHILFQNTGREMPETLDFIQQMSQNWGANVTWLEYTTDNAELFQIVGHNSADRSGKPFEQLIEKKKMLPNVVMRFCTEEMKIRTAKRYLQSLGYEYWYTVVGFRADETSRVSGLEKRRRERETPLTPLYHAGITKQMVSDWWKNQPFNLNLPDNGGKTPLGNCDGCFLKSEKNLASLCRTHPDRAEWWAEQETKVKKAGTADSAGTFNKDTSWRELIEFVRNQPDFIHDLDDEESPFCTTSYGGCAEY